jgi:hypothetical protein
MTWRALWRDAYDCSSAMITRAAVDGWGVSVPQARLTNAVLERLVDVRQMGTSADTAVGAGMAWASALFRWGRP